MTSKKTKIRIPQQERSRKTKARILKSAEDLFSKKGFHKTNSKEIAKHAGVAVGNFYAYFKNKKAVLLELLEGHNQQVIDSILTFLESRDLTTDDPRDFFVSMIESILKAHDHLPDYHKDITPLIHGDPDVKAMMNQFHRVSLEKVKGSNPAGDAHAGAAVGGIEKHLGSFDDQSATLRHGIPGVDH